MNVPPPCACPPTHRACIPLRRHWTSEAARQGLDASEEGVFQGVGSSDAVLYLALDQFQDDFPARCRQLLLVRVGVVTGVRSR